MQKTIHSDEHAALCKLLKAKRRKFALTQSALAEHLEMPQSFVSKVERGERLLDVIEFARYLSVMGVDPVQGFSELIRVIMLPANAPKVLSSKKRPRT